jgi:hypothetical protein
MGGCCSTESHLSPPRDALASNTNIDQIVSHFTEDGPGVVYEKIFVLKEPHLFQENGSQQNYMYQASIISTTF